jgi:RNA polymerase sigma-70 factor (ECF subfamily)
VESYQIPIYNLAYRMLGGPTQAEDATQETFLRVYTRFETYDPSRKFSSWILSIASHYCIDQLRKRRNGSLSMEEIEGKRWIPGSLPDPELSAMGEEQEEVISKLLDELPPHYRLVIVLRYWYDYSYDEIAVITESTESAVKSRLYRARRMLAEKLERIGSLVELDEVS